MEQSEESWDDIFSQYDKYLDKYLNGPVGKEKAPYAIRTWLKKDYYPPIAKDAVKESMYTKDEVEDLLIKLDHDNYANPYFSVYQFIQEHLK